MIRKWGQATRAPAIVLALAGLVLATVMGIGITIDHALVPPFVSPPPIAEKPSGSQDAAVVQLRAALRAPQLAAFVDNVQALGGPAAGRGGASILAPVRLGPPPGVFVLGLNLSRNQPGVPPSQTGGGNASANPPGGGQGATGIGGPTGAGRSGSSTGGEGSGNEPGGPGRNQPAGGSGPGSGSQGNQGGNGFSQEESHESGSAGVHEHGQNKGGQGKGHGHPATAGSDHSAKIEESSDAQGGDGAGHHKAQHTQDD